MNLKKQYELNFSPEVKEVLASVGSFSKQKGINSYIIGGVVRDLILNKPVFDIDIVVESDAILFAQQLITCINGEILAVQEKLRTAKVLFENGVEIDFSSTRKEFYSASGQLPVLSEFGCSLEEDVKRRDFTVNTLALKLGEEPVIIDFLNGLEDLKNKKLRVLHDKSFIDDPSRLVRLLKFAIRFDFDIETHTEKLMAEYLNNIDMTMPLERIKGEFKQLFALNSQKAYDITVETGIYKLVSSEFPAQFSQEKLNYALKKGFISTSFSWFVPLACLSINSPEYWERLNLNSQEKRCLNDFQLLMSSSSKDISENDNFKIYERYSKLSEEGIVCEFVSIGSKEGEKYLETLKNTHLLINGNDLISLGFVPSEKFKQIFDEVLKKKLNNELLTKEEEIEFVKKFCR